MKKNILGEIKSVHHQLGEVFAQDGFGLLDFFGRVFLDVAKLVFPTHGLVFMYAKCVVGQEFHALNLFVALEVFAQGAQVGLGIAQFRHKDIAEPERMPRGFEPFCGFERLGIAPGRESLVL